MSDPKAIISCKACRRLKRKCSKEMPACAQCTRLNRECEYAGVQNPYPNILAEVTGRLRQLEQRLVDSHSPYPPQRPCPAPRPAVIASGMNPPLPAAFFLDNEAFTSLGFNTLSRGIDSSLWPGILDSLGLDSTQIFEKYFLSIHPWFPFLSKKRLTHEHRNRSANVDAFESLLIMCLGLLIEEVPQTTAQDSQASSLYSLIKPIVADAGNSGRISLRLLQSLVLLTLYELGHAIYPTAYLTLSHAARMGIIMGLHSGSKPSNLFQSPDSWTLREEQHRTWWAIMILDRFANIGAGGLPLCTPEPTRADLLPVNDTAWEEGKVVINEPLYTTEFCCVTMVSPFARLCQAAHILGKILRHNDSAEEDPAYVLPEALQFHRALASLREMLEHKEDFSSNVSALSLCCSAMFLLYDRYQAIRSDQTRRLPEETELRDLTLHNIRALASITIPKIAQLIQHEPALAHSPLVGSSLYRGANICAWLIREDHNPESYDALDSIVTGLCELNKRWPVAGQYIQLLGNNGVLEFCGSTTFSMIDNDEEV